MPYIIDGDALLLNCPEIPAGDPNAQSKLVVILKKFQENKKNNILTFFKNQPENGSLKEESSSKFSVCFPPESSTVSQEIRKTLDKFSSFKDVVIVTADRDLKSYGKSKGARTSNPIEFYFDLKRVSRVFGQEEESQKRIDATVSDREVDQWLKIFDR